MVKDAFEQYKLRCSRYGVHLGGAGIPRPGDTAYFWHAKRRRKKVILRRKDCPWFLQRRASRKRIEVSGATSVLERRFHGSVIIEDAEERSRNSQRYFRDGQTSGRRSSATSAVLSQIHRNITRRVSWDSGTHRVWFLGSRRSNFDVFERNKET